MRTEADSVEFLALQGWRPVKPMHGFEHLGACYAAPWDTGRLYAIPQADALRIARYALETGRQATPSCAQLEAFELRRAQEFHARRIG